MWKQTAAYGALLALGTLALQWLDYQWLSRIHTTELTISLVAAAFLVLGLLIRKRGQVHLRVEEGGRNTLSYHFWKHVEPIP